MKSYIDFFETLKGEFIGSLKFKNKFIRLWGITSIDGIQVLNSKFEVYPNTESMHVQRFLKHIGSQSQINEADFNGVQSYYFWLNASKADTLNQEDLNDIIASKINSYCAVGEKLIINLNFSNAGDYNYFKNFTKQQIFDYVNNDYDNLYNTLDNYAVGETLLTSTIGSYILFDNGQHFDISILKATVSSIATKVKLNVFDDDYTTVYKVGISLEIEALRRDNITGSANIVTHIVDEATEFTSTEATRLQQLLESDSNDNTSNSAWIKNRKEKTDDIWYKGQMRVSFIEDSVIKTKEKIRILISSIDTGFTQKKTKWYKKILGFVLIVIAIVVAIFFPPAGGILMGIAINVGVAVMVMVGIQSYWAKHGDPAAAEYIGRWIKVGQIISAVTGIAGIVANIARQAATTAATTAATEAAATTGGTATVTATTLGQTATVTATAEVTAYGTTTTIVEGGTGALISETVSVGFGDFISAGWDSFAGSMTSSWQNIASSALKMVRFFTNMRFQSQAKSLQSEINAKTEQNDKAEKELEELNDKEVNIALDDIRWYTSPLKLESQRFDVDYLYGGTRMNIGRPSFCTGRGLNIISNDIYDVSKIGKI